MSDLHREVVRLRHLVTEKDDEIRALRRELTGDLDRHVGRFGLTPTEARILAVLEQRGKVSKESLVTLVWSDKEYVSPETVCAHVYKTRKKLPPGVTIDTLWGFGYVMTPTSRDALCRYVEPTGPSLVPDMRDMVA